MNLTYTTGIPDTPNNPSNDQPNMKVNTNSINSLIQIDHHGFNDNLGGYHTIIHQDSSTRTRSGVGAVTSGFPAAIPNVGQVFTALYTPDTAGGTADTQLFSLTGSNGLSQLTGNSAATEGFQWIGGVLIQWGVGTLNSSSTDHKVVDITFKNRAFGAIEFPNNCFVVTATLAIASAATTTASNTIAIRSFDKTTFRAVYNSSASDGTDKFPSFYWIAIGN